MIFDKTNTPQHYYVYAYLRSKDSDTASYGTPYYIGKGKDKRAWAQNHRVNIPDDPKYIIILEHNLTEVGSLAIERRLIAWYGRKDLGTGILENRTDGGDSNESAIRTIEWKTNIANAHKGKTLSDSHRLSMSLQRKNKPWTEARREAYVNNPPRREMPDETRAKISAAQKGKPRAKRSIESRLKQSNTTKGHIVLDSTRAKISAANKGKTYKQKHKRPADSNANHHGTLWWNNGTTNKRSASCPGLEWTQGMIAKNVK